MLQNLRLGYNKQKVFEMKFKRNSVLSLYLDGKSQAAFVRDRKGSTTFVYRTLTLK